MTPVSGKTLEDLCQDINHRREIIRIELNSRELMESSSETKDKINFPPTSAKCIWEKLDITLCKELDKQLRGKILERRLEAFSSVI